MSFQSFSKLPPPPRNRPKNLPSIELVTLLNSLCDNTNNKYDARNHILTINEQKALIANLEEKIDRSLYSFEKQLRFVGFKKHRQVFYDQKDDNQQEQIERYVIKYYWRGKKEEYIAKQLDFSEKQLESMIMKASQLKANLQNKKSKLDQVFEKCIFWGLNRHSSAISVNQTYSTTINSAIETINQTHKHSGQLLRDLQISLQSQISLVRLLTYRQNQVPQE